MKTTIINFSGAIKGGDLLLVGKCDQCHGDVARVIEAAILSAPQPGADPSRQADAAGRTWPEANKKCFSRRFSQKTCVRLSS
jgi:hypothetical protein